MPSRLLELSRPFFLVKTLDKDSGDLKFAWSPNLFTDAEKPDDDSKIAPDTYIEDIEVKSSFQPPINISEVKISHGVGKTPKIALKDILSIHFGYYALDDSQNSGYSQVYTGEIDFIKTSLNHTTIKASCKIKKLIELKRDLAFSKIMTISDIIEKLAITDGGLESAPNGITTTTISKQKGYAISKNLSIYKHIKKLADFVGFDIYMDVFDKFNAREWSPEPVSTQNNSNGQPLAIAWISDRGDSESDVQKQLMHQLYFGVNILDMDLNIEKGGPTSIEIVSLVDSDEGEIFSTEPPVGTSPSTGGSGDGDGGTNGSSSVPEKIVLSRFTKADADKIAEAIAKQNSDALTGNVTVVGAPQIRLGDGVKIKGHIFGKKPFSKIDISTSEYDASYTTDEEEEGGSGGSETSFKITEIKHLFNNNLGFITKLSVSEAEPVEPTVAEETGEAETEIVILGESDEVEFGGIAAEVVPIETVEEGEYEERLVNIIVRTLDPNKEPMPNTEYVLITPEEEEIEGTSGDDGTFTHEEMAVGRYQLKLKPITDPSEEEGGEGEGSEEE